MSLWGTADSIFSPGTVIIDYANERIIGTGTSFRASGVGTGAVITIGVGGTFGKAVVSGVTSERVISIATTQYLTGAATPTGVAYTMSREPVYTLEDSHYSRNYAGVTTTSPTVDVVGVDVYEAAAAELGNYGVTHSGWVGIMTYVDMHGNLRVKTETLVAMSGISTDAASYTAPGDATDDAQFPDQFITITSQPTNRVGIATTSATTFAVIATATPSASLSYQWQYSSTGIAYTNLSNGGIYSNVTTATVGIGSTTVTATRPNGHYFRSVVTTTGGATATSNAATLTYA